MHLHIIYMKPVISHLRAEQSLTDWDMFVSTIDDVLEHTQSATTFPLESKILSH